MLTAKKSGWFEKVFAVYNRNLFKRRFYSLKVSGLEYLTGRNKQIPLIIYANHSSWWDGLVAFEISRAARLNAFLMMEEKQLKQFSLFRRLGVFSIVRENSREAVRSINYAVNLLGEERSPALWIFPQGEIQPHEARPVKFYNGVSRIIEKLDNCCVVPLAMRYEFRGEFKPEIFVKIGSVVQLEIEKEFYSKGLTKGFEKDLTVLLDDLKTDVLNDNVASYSKIF